MAFATLMSIALMAAPVPKPTTPDATASAFVDAFRAMGEARFDRFFAPDVTTFFPDGPFPKGERSKQTSLQWVFSFLSRSRCRQV